MKKNKRGRPSEGKTRDARYVRITRPAYEYIKAKCAEERRSFIDQLDVLLGI